ncbi:MAG: hypothetical protein ACO1RX_01350 [Candidatus Sericytochromatia bacterium]
MASLLVIFAGVSAAVVRGSNRDNQEEFRRRAQAANIARAGIQDATGWFKKKSASSGAVANPAPYPDTKPCADAAFAPAYHEDPKLRETEDADVGLVKDIILDPSRNLYGRYTIRKQPCTVGTGDVLPNEAEFDRLAAHDVTEERGKGVRGEGLMWSMVSEGVIYQRNDRQRNADGVFVKGPDDAPNKLLDSTQVSVEISRLSLRKPQAPITIVDPYLGDKSASSFNNRCEVRGREARAVLIYEGTNRGSGTGTVPSNKPTCQFEDCTGDRQNIDQRESTEVDPMTVQEIFGVTQNELRSISDFIHTGIDDLKRAHLDKTAGRMKLPMALYYIENSITVTTSTPLTGSGILFVNGDLTAQADAFAFSGLVYVTGTLTMNDNSDVAGAAVASRVVCSPSQKAGFEYNIGILETVRDKLALYRENTVTFVNN